MTVKIASVAIHVAMAVVYTSSLHFTILITSSVAMVLNTSPVSMILNTPSVTIVLNTSSVAVAGNTGRAVSRRTEITTIPAVMHAEVLSVRSAIVIPVSVIIAMSSMSVPGMSATIGIIEMRTSEVEVVTMWITTVYAEVPETSLPIKRTIEVACCYIGTPLPVEQDIAQVQISALPIGAEYIRTACDTHQIVEVDLICSLVLIVSQIQLVSHLISQEQRLISGLFVAHCTCCHCRGEHHQCEKQLLHNRIILIV